MSDPDLERLIVELRRRRANIAKAIEESTTTRMQREKLLEGLERIRARIARTCGKDQPDEPEVP
jgi:hypothetical protein